MNINLSSVQQTLLLPLWSRAKLTRENSPILTDIKAVELIDKIHYDFSRIDKYVPYVNHLMNVVRAATFDEAIKQYLIKYPKASVVNLGAGLDTSFFHVDNSLINWYDIDLPDVMTAIGDVVKLLNSDLETVPGKHSSNNRLQDIY